MKTLSPAAALLTAAVLLTGPSAAQEAGAIALDQLDPAPAGDPFFAVPSPFIGGHLVPRAQLLFSHAGSPLTLSSGDTDRAVVASQSLLHIGAALALFDRLQLSAQLPLAISQTGDGAPGVADAPEAIPDAPALGDLRLGARVRILGDERAPFQLATGFALHLPTGASDNYLGDGAVRITPQLLLGGRAPGLLTWSAFVGGTLRGSGNPSTLDYGAAAALLLWNDRLQLGPEFRAATPLQGGSLGLTERTRVEHARATRAELLLGARAWLWRGLALGAAGGPGLGEGIGTPAFRLVGTLSWSPLPEDPDAPPAGPIDTDADGLLDPQDACPYAHGPRSADPKRNGCPVDDRDDDTLADADDACPDLPGVPSPDPRKRGCPADADNDGVPDTLDACPTDPGPAESIGARPGCPAPPPPPPVTDRDGDGLNDDQDACPAEKGPPGDDPAARGCPKRVRVKGDEIHLLEPVTFRISAAPLPPIESKSEAALAELKEVIDQHPEWLKIEVQAHTDNTGNPKYNETLSQMRAESVKKWLTDKGVAAERLVAKGHGGGKPIADNATAAGREKNRRVLLVVVEKK